MLYDQRVSLPERSEGRQKTRRFVSLRRVMSPVVILYLYGWMIRKQYVIHKVYPPVLESSSVI